MKTIPHFQLFSFIVLCLLLAFPDRASGQIEHQASYSDQFDPNEHLNTLLTRSSRSTYLQNQRSGNTMEMVSFLSLPGHPISDVWALGDYAYVGGWGANTTVRVVDISRPASPAVVATIPPMGPGTSPQDLKAGKINTSYFKGDILVVGNDGFNGGIEIYDVRNPESPALLGSYAEPFVHNAFIYQKNHRAFVLVAVPTREVGFYCCPQIVTSPGEFMVIEITDPTNPTLIGEWAAGTDGGFGSGLSFFPVPPGRVCTTCRGNSPVALLHNVWANKQGTVAYLAYWDLGLILLDISVPENPTLISQTTEPPALGSDQGDCHIAVPANGGNLVLVGDETFNTQPWGFIRIFDTSDPSNPTQVSTFATPRTLTNTDNNLWTSVHNIFVRGNRAYVSWYNEGIRVIDFSTPSDPQEVGHFQAPAGTTDPSLLWGVYVHGSYILASDVSGGLFILKMNGEGPMNNLALEDQNIELAGGEEIKFTGLRSSPNPFKEETKIRFQLTEKSQVTLKVFDYSGKLIRILANEQLGAGNHTINWDGRDSRGNKLADGIYYCNLNDGVKSQSMKLALTK